MFRPDLDQLPEYRPGARNDRAVKLSSNESAEAPLPTVREAMARSLEQINRYPDNGAAELREALAAHLGVAPEQVAVGNGSSGLCLQLVSATAGAGDEVIFPWRSFEAYPIFAQVAGATPVPVPLNAEHGLDMGALAAAVTERTRLIFVCNPNNPTGTTITTQEFADFMAKVPSDVVVALDEAYFEYNRATDTPVATEEIAKYPNVVGLRTFSKAYGLAGARVGYAFGPRRIISALNRVAVPFSVSVPAQAGAVASLELVDELRARTDTTCAQRARLEDFFAAYGTPHSEANFVWVPAAHLGRTPQEAAKALEQADLLVRAFDEGIRITVTDEAEADAAMRVWAEVLQG